MVESQRLVATICKQNCPRNFSILPVIVECHRNDQKDGQLYCLARVQPETFSEFGWVQSTYRPIPVSTRHFLPTAPELFLLPTVVFEQRCSMGSLLWYPLSNVQWLHFVSFKPYDEIRLEKQVTIPRSFPMRFLCAQKFQVPPWRNVPEQYKRCESSHDPPCHSTECGRKPYEPPNGVHKDLPSSKWNTNPGWSDCQVPAVMALAHSSERDRNFG